MPTPKKGARLGGSPAHQRLILSNLATALFEHGRITTTEAKARTLRPVAEKLITKAKRYDLGTSQSLHMRREVLKTIRDKGVVHALFTEIAPTFAERPGGYTRITKIGPRKGDNAPMAVIELVQESFTPKASTKPAKTAAPAPVEDEVVETEETTEPVALVDTDATEETADELPAGAHAPLADENEAPEGFPIKGNQDSMKFHEPDGQWFEQTVAELWFDTPESAEAAGFTRAGD